MAIIPIDNRIQIGIKTSSIDNRYGPWDSIAAAYEALGPNDMDVISEGLTIGIWTDNTKKTIIEYWFQGGTALENLVPKSSVFTVDMKGVSSGYIIPSSGSTCAFTYDGVPIYSVPCVYNESNVTLVYAHLMDEGELVNKAYIVAGRTVTNVYTDDDIPSWIKNILPEVLSKKVEELDDITTWK